MNFLGVESIERRIASERHMNFTEFGGSADIDEFDVVTGSDARSEILSGNGLHHDSDNPLLSVNQRNETGVRYDFLGREQVRIPKGR